MYRTSSTPQHQHPPMLPLPRHRQQLYYESANNSSILGTTVNDNDDYNYQNEGRGALYPQQDYISNFQQQQLQQALPQHRRHYYDVDHSSGKEECLDSCRTFLPQKQNIQLRRPIYDDRGINNADFVLSRPPAPMSQRDDFYG